MEPTIQQQPINTIPENKSSIGSIIGTIIIIAVIILGGLYFWGKRVEEAKIRQNLVTETVPQNNQMDEAAVIKSTSASDDLDSIDADLNATKLDNLNAEMSVQAM